MMFLESLNFAQYLGLLSFSLGMICFWQKQDVRLKLMMALMLAVHSIHFLLLEAHVSALMCLFGLIRTLASVKARPPEFAYFFIGLTVVFGLITIQQPTDVLPIIAACVGTYSLFLLAGIKLRLGMMIGGLLWLINNILVGSVGGMLLESCLLVVNIITITRLKFSHLRTTS